MLQELCDQIIKKLDWTCVDIVEWPESKSVQFIPHQLDHYTTYLYTLGLRKWLLAGLQIGFFQSLESKLQGYII